MQKIAHFCQVEDDQVLAVHDMPTIYQVPILLHEQGLISLLRRGLKLEDCAVKNEHLQKGDDIWNTWKQLTLVNPMHLEPVTIALVGKYIELHDSYLSVIKSLEHCTMKCKRRLNIVWVDAEDLESSNSDKSPIKFHKAWHDMCTADGILVPGGFGLRGTEGMIAAAKWARENSRPYLGICLGMQVAVIEYARNVCGITNATSEEFSKTSGDGTNVIVFMPEIDKSTMGGTMRLGRRPTLFQPGSEWSKLRALYADKDGVIEERHRHRYEVNPEQTEKLEAAGLRFIGKDDQGVRMEIIELKDHPWFVGVQFHPEYLSRVLDPSRPYLGFIAASAGCLAEITRQQANLTNGASINKMNGHVDAGEF